MNTHTQTGPWIWCQHSKDHWALFCDEDGNASHVNARNTKPGYDHQPIPPVGEDGPGAKAMLVHPTLRTDPEEHIAEAYAAGVRWTLRTCRLDDGWVAEAVVHDKHGMRYWSCDGTSRSDATRELRDKCGAKLPGSAGWILNAWVAGVGP